MNSSHEAEKKKKRAPNIAGHRRTLAARAEAEFRLNRRRPAVEKIWLLDGENGAFHASVITSALVQSPRRRRTSTRLRGREWVRERSKTSSTSLCAVHACKRETACCCCCVDVTHYNNYTHQHHYSRGELGKETSIFLLKLRSSRSSKNYLFSCFGHFFNDCEVLRRYVWKLFDVGKLSESFWATPRPLFCNFLTILLP